jgi:hypothetical protein
MMLTICYDLFYAYDLLWSTICLCSGMICYMLCSIMICYMLMFYMILESMMLMICE